MEINLSIDNRKGFTGFCDTDGNLIYLGDRVEFTHHSGAIWSGIVVFEDGMITVSISDVEQIKNPNDWKQSYDWINSRWWSASVGYGEYGTWNDPRNNIIEIAGNFKSYEEYKEAQEKCADKNDQFTHNYIFRPLPIRIINQSVD